MDMTCEQFETLMQFYVNNDLTEEIKQKFETHMLKCKSCREKYNTFKKIILDLRESYKTFSNSKVNYKSLSSTETLLNSNISAYIDNELDIEDNIKIKKLLINNSEIRGKIEKIYNLKSLLKESFDKSQPMQDFSQSLINKIYPQKQYSFNKNILYPLISFIVLSIIWIIMLISTIK